MKFLKQLSHKTPANGSFCCYLSGKCFDQKIIFRKKNISFNYSHLFFDIQWHVFTGIKCITDVQELNM